MTTLRWTAVTAVLASVAVVWGLGSRRSDPTDLVSIPAGSFSYPAAGEFLREGAPADAPLVETTFHTPLVIMRRQVSASEYAACVAVGACAGGSNGGAGLEPVVGVSFLDAQRYAAWFSRRTGHRYRLPSDAEWAYAAGEGFHDDALNVAGDAANPSVRWLAAYDRESAAKAPIQSRSIGSVAENRRGVAGLEDDTWEWTTTCFMRQAQRDGTSGTTFENCGVRVAEGRHRAYLNDFVRDPKGGACSAGPPPANLGIRLVRDDGVIASYLVPALRRFFLALFDRDQRTTGRAS